MMKGIFQGLLLAAVAYAGWYAWKNDMISLDTRNAEGGCKNCKDVVKEMEIHDYGSLQQPVSLEYGSDGQAIGQLNVPYGNPESAFVPALGQNYQGRAFGL